MLDGSGLDKNVIIFAVDNSCSAHGYNKNKDILILDKVLTHGLDDSAITAEDEYSINFSK